MRKLFTLLLAVGFVFTMTACSTNNNNETPAPEQTTTAETTSHKLQLGQTLFAAHGTKCFTTATVVIEDDTVVAAFIDEYQYLSAETTTGVPNSENFTDYVTEGFVLGSKRVNNESYSANMAAAGSTIELAKNYDAIQEFVVGKTVTELAELSTKTKEEVVELVSGATLVDAQGYINAIAAAGVDAKTNPTFTYDGDLSKLVLNQTNGAPHGTKCFAVTSVVTDGTTVYAAYIDEFQYLSAETTTGVPNSENFTDYVTEGFVLGSKRVNNESYSANMAAAGSTIELAKNYDAIQEFVVGKTVTELAELSTKTKEEVVELVSGATLVDAQGYIAEIVKTVSETK